MQHLVLVGASHRTAPLPILERLSTPADLVPALLDDLRAVGADEVAVLSTCSRTEVYATATGLAAAGALADVLAARVGLPAGAPGRWVRLHGPAVAEHLLRVATGLESRVAGEVEIQGQVRAAARLAERHGSLGPALRTVFDAAVATARRAHRDTALGGLGRSVGRSGVDVALRGLGLLHPRVAVVGTGRMARVATERLGEHGMAPIVYARSPQGAPHPGLGPCPVERLDRLPGALPTFDVVICATSSGDHLITAATARDAATGGHRLTLVDLGVPRNIDPAARSIPGIRLVDVEDLADDPGGSHSGELATALDEAAGVVRAGLQRLHDADHRRAAGPVIGQLHREVEEACHRLYQQRPELADGPIDRAARVAARRAVHQSIDEVLAAVHQGDHDAVARIFDRLTSPVHAAAAAGDHINRPPHLSIGTTT